MDVDKLNGSQLRQLVWSQAAKIEELHQEILRLKAGHADLAQMHAAAGADLHMTVRRAEETNDG